MAESTDFSNAVPFGELVIVDDEDEDSVYTIVTLHESFLKFDKSLKLKLLNGWASALESLAEDVDLEDVVIH